MSRLWRWYGQGCEAHVSDAVAMVVVVFEMEVSKSTLLRLLRQWLWLVVMVVGGFGWL